MLQLEIKLTVYQKLSKSTEAEFDYTDIERKHISKVLSSSIEKIGVETGGRRFIFTVAGVKFK